MAQKRDSLLMLLSSSVEDTNKAMLYYRLSLSYVHDSKDSAVAMAKRASELSKKLKFTKGVIAANGALGSLKFNEGNYNEALNIFLQCLELARTSGKRNYVANIGMNIATVFCENGDFKRALEYYAEVRQVYEENKDGYGIAKVCLAIGIAQKNLKKYEEAKKSYETALEKAKLLNDHDLLTELYNNIAVLYEEIDKPKALEYHLRALKYEESIKDDYSIAISNLNIGDLLNKMNEYKKAEPYLISGLNYILTTGEKDWELSTYGSLADTYLGLKDHEKANVYLMKQKQLGDSLFNQEKATQLNEMQARYDAQKKENDILLLKEQNAITNRVAEKRKIWMITISTVTVCLLLALLLIVAINRNRKKQKEIEFITAKAELEQTALRAQMNPHFVFNALNSIQHYILNKETEYAYDYLAKFSKLIRQVLINSEENTISLDKEIETLKLYVELEQRRLKNRFDFEIKLADDFPMHDINIPNMLIQPFIENAIWHGIMNLDKNKKGNLELGFSLMGKKLKITAEDNGVGRKEAALRKMKSEYESVGMLFTQKRLELLKEITKQNTEITVTDLADETGKAKGTKVEILIELVA